MGGGGEEDVAMEKGDDKWGEGGMDEGERQERGGRGGSVEEVENVTQQLWREF